MSISSGSSRRSEHPHGSTDREFDGLFTTDKPIIFSFHGYRRLIHRLASRFAGHANLHVHGYKEKGNINTPIELAMLNETSRFHLVIDMIDRVAGLRVKGAHLKEQMTNAIIDNMRYAHEHGTDRPEVANGTWPYWRDDMPTDTRCTGGVATGCLPRCSFRR